MIFSFETPVLRLVQRIGTTDPNVHFFTQADGSVGSSRQFLSQASASGVGDIHVLGKARVFQAESTAVAVGLDVRFPSGDEDDLLGTGAMGFRPFAAISTSGKKLSVHVNASYQWNGESVLGGDIETRTKDDLPDQFLYVGGVDFSCNEISS